MKVKHFAQKLSSNFDNGSLGALSLVKEMRRHGSRLDTVLLNENKCTASVWERVCDILLESDQSQSISDSVTSLIPSRLFLENLPLHPDDVTMRCRSGGHARAIMSDILEKKRLFMNEMKVPNEIRYSEASPYLLQNIWTQSKYEFDRKWSHNISDNVTPHPRSKCPGRLASHMLSDQQMANFIAMGHLMIDPGVTPYIHDRIHSELAGMYANEYNPGNNILARLPLLRRILDSSPIQGALTGILGDKYVIHPHRHSHKGSSDRPPQTWHRDSYWGYDRIRERNISDCIFLFYFPQDTPSSSGPTELVSGSQYYSRKGGESLRRICDRLFRTQYEARWDVKRTSFNVQKGSVILSHFDIWHRGGANTSSSDRHMVKFIAQRSVYSLEIIPLISEISFSDRMTSPQTRLWNHVTHAPPDWTSFIGHSSRSLLWSQIWAQLVSFCSDCRRDQMNKKWCGGGGKTILNPAFEMNEAERLKYLLSLGSMTTHPSIVSLVSFVTGNDKNQSIFPLEAVERDELLSMEGWQHDASTSLALFASEASFEILLNFVKTLNMTIRRSHGEVSKGNESGKFGWKAVEMLFFTLMSSPKDALTPKLGNEILYNVTAFLATSCVPSAECHKQLEMLPLAHPLSIEQALDCVGSFASFLNVSEFNLNMVVSVTLWVSLHGIGTSVGWDNISISVNDDDFPNIFQIESYPRDVRTNIPLVPIFPIQASASRALLRWINSQHYHMISSELKREISEGVTQILSRSTNLETFTDRYLIGYVLEIGRVLQREIVKEGERDGREEREEGKEENSFSAFLMEFYHTSHWCPHTVPSSGY